MKARALSPWAVRLGIPTALAVFLSLVWGVPYIFTFIGFSAWVFIGHLVTADDDLPGGFSNPDGSLPFPWAELAIKGLILLALVLLAAMFPALRHFGEAG